MNTNCVILWFSVLILLPSICSKRTLPDFVKICKRNDEIDKCLVESIMHLRPYIAKGIPAMKIPPLDPFKIPKTTYDSNNLKIEFSDIEAYNLTNVEIQNAHIDFERQFVSINCTNRDLQVYGNYKVIGKFASFALEGSGKISMNTSLSLSHIKFSWKIIKKGDAEYGKIDNFDYFVDIHDFQTELTNLFANNPELTATVNRVINESGKETSEDVIKSIFRAILYNTIGNVFDQFPFDVLIPKE